jgi:hypothetical protein
MVVNEPLRALSGCAAGDFCPAGLAECGYNGEIPAAGKIGQEMSEEFRAAWQG